MPRRRKIKSVGIGRSAFVEKKKVRPTLLDHPLRRKDFWNITNDPAFRPRKKEEVSYVLRKKNKVWLILKALTGKRRYGFPTAEKLATYKENEKGASAFYLITLSIFAKGGPRTGRSHRKENPTLNFRS